MLEPIHVKSDKMRSKAFRKYQADREVRILLDHARKVKSPLVKSYERMLNCQHQVNQCFSDSDKQGTGEGGYRLITQRCKQRFCVSCNNIKTGKLFNLYSPEIKKFKDPRHVVLSRRSVNVRKYDSEVVDLFKLFNLCLRHCNEVLFLHLNGFRSFETSYNWRTENAHGHFHILVDGESNANSLIDKWLSLNKKKADYQSQWNVEANENTLHELLKYALKQDSSERIKDETTGELIVHITPFAKDLIYRALSRKKLVRPFGSLLGLASKQEPYEPQLYIGLPKIQFSQELISKYDFKQKKTIYSFKVILTRENCFKFLNGDWRQVNSKIPFLLTGYKPPKKNERGFIKLITHKERISNIRINV